MSCQPLEWALIAVFVAGMVVMVLSLVNAWQFAKRFK